MSICCIFLNLLSPHNNLSGIDFRMALGNLSMMIGALLEAVLYIFITVEVEDELNIQKNEK